MPKREVTRAIVRELERSVVRPYFDKNFPPPDFGSVYQGASGVYVVTDILGVDAATDFSITVDMYIPVHTDTIRPIIGLTNAFTIANQTSWQLIIRADNTLSLAVRDGGVTGNLVHLTLPISTGIWHYVTASYINETMYLNVSGAENVLSVPQRLGSSPAPHRIFSPTLSSEGIQVSDFRVAYGSGHKFEYPCAEGSGLLCKDYIAKDLNSPTNGVISDDLIHQTRL